MNLTFFNVLLSFTMSLTSFTTITGELSNEVCQNSRECGYCGYCVFTKKIEKSKENKSRCLYPFDGVDQQYKKCYPKLLCKKDTCHGGECTHGFGYYAPRCFCLDTNFYGNYCDKKMYLHHTKKDYATGIAVYFKKNLKVSHLYTVDIYVTTVNSGNDLQFDVLTSEGFIGRFNKLMGKCVDNNVRLNPYKEEAECRPEERCHLYLSDCEDVYTARVPFPYKSPLIPSVFTVDHSMCAYEASIKITVTNMISPLRIAVFEHEYPLIVGLYSYDLYSQLILKLKYCSRFFQQRNIYFRQTPIKFSAEVEPFVSELKVAWTVWKAIWTEDAIPVTYSYSDKLVWTLEQFTLPLGSYKLQVKASRIYELNLLSNFAECYFEIKAQPIVATIAGGNVRTVSRNDGLFFSADNSFDPNERRSNQNHLRFSWNCENFSGRKCYTFVSSNSRSVFIPAEYLNVNDTYIYTVTITAPGLKPANASQIVHVLEFSVSIRCLSNCFANVIPTEVLLLRATLPKHVSLDYKFDWTYKIKHESETWYLTDPFQDKSYPADTLCIKPGSLEGGKTYLFRVLAVYRARVLTSVIELNIARKPENVSCTVSPLSGVFAETLFNINCSGLVIDDAILVYEYFDMYKSEEIFNGEIFSGRMLASNYDGKLDNVKLTRGIVVVVVNTIQGYSIIFKNEIKLSSKNFTSKDVDNTFIQIQQSLEVGHVHRVLRKISQVPDIIVTPISYIGLGNIFEPLVDLQSKVPIKGEEDVKMGLSVIRNVIETLSRKLNYVPNLMVLKKTLKEKKRLSELFKTNIVEKYNELYVTRIMLSELVCTFVYLIEILFDEKNLLQMNKTDLNKVNFRTLQDTSIFAEEIFNDITYAVSFRQDFGLKPYNGATVSGLSKISSQSDSPSTLASLMNREKQFNSNLAPPLVKTLQTYSRLTVHTLTTQINPFLGENYSVSTKLTSLSLYGNKNMKSDMVRLALLKQPIDIFLETTQVEFGEITLVVKQLDPKISESVLDIEVPVVRIDLPEKCKLFIEFLLPNGTNELRVSVKDNLRPSFESVAESPTMITSSSTMFDVPYNGSDRRRFVYVGILPSQITPVGDEVKLTVRFYSNLCLSRIGYQWDPKSCSVGPLTNKSVIHCRCTHLSFFAASFVIPPNKIDPFSDFHMFLTVKDNPLVLLYLLCLIVLFLLLYIWALNKDRRDSKMRKIIVLEDNFPCDEYLYVIAVFTGSRFFSGTKANVGIRIDGTISRSRSHILKATGFKGFRKNSDSWFLLRTADRLGVPKYIYIWHDNSGTSPDWYCDKILLYDLKVSTVYTFFVEQWLAIGKNKYPEAVIFPATASEFRRFGRIILENIVRELQHFHIFGRIFSSNVHNRMTRLDRIMIFNSSFMSANLINIAYFKVDIGTSTGVDEANFFFSTKYLYLSFQVLTLTLVVSLVLDFIFQKSYDLKSSKIKVGFKTESSLNEIKVYVRPSPVIPMPKKSNLLTLIKHVNSARTNQTFYHYLVRIFLNKSKPMQFLPVALSRSSTSNKRKLKGYILAVTLSILLIFVSFFFTFLYGLKLGHEKSKLWLCTLLLASVQQYLLVLPIKMFIVAIVLASQFQYLTPISSYNVVVDGILQQVQDCYTFYCSLIDKRKNRMYQPLSDAKIVIFKKDNEQNELLFKMLEFIMVIIFTFVIIQVCNIYWSTRTVYSNVHARAMIASGAIPNVVNYADISNRTQLEDYLQYILGNSKTVYNSIWYNGMDLYHPQDFTVPGLSTRDSVLTLLGAPVLRQVRVNGIACHFPSVFENASLECIPSWRPDLEDTQDYNEKWTPSSWKPEKHEPTVWEYSDNSSLSYRSSTSPTGTLYPSGGYVAKLSLERSHTRLVMFQLINDHWIDQLTRVLFVEFTLYNVNRNSFTHVSLIAEQLPYGVVLTRALSESVQLEVLEILWTVSFSMIILLLFVKDVLEINRHGFVQYLSSIENAYQVLLICLGTGSIVFFIAHVTVSARYISEFNTHTDENTFVFSKIINYHKVSSVFATALFCCLVIRLLSLTWLFGQEFSVIYTALKKSAIHVTVFFIIVLVSTLLFEEAINYLLCNFSSRSTSLVASLISLNSAKHIDPNISDLSYFIWNRFLFILIIVLVTKKYKIAHNNKFKPNNKQFRFIPFVNN